MGEQGDGGGARTGELHIRKWPGVLKENWGLDRQGSKRVSLARAGSPREERESESVRLAQAYAQHAQVGVIADCRLGLQRCTECFDASCSDNENPLLSALGPAAQREARSEDDKRTPGSKGGGLSPPGAGPAEAPLRAHPTILTALLEYLDGSGDAEMRAVAEALP